MELARSGNPEGIIEEVVTSKKISIARNKAGPKAFMNNAPVDNFGTKEYKYVSRLTLKPTSILRMERLKSQK
jgi:hypothetical protein